MSTYLRAISATREILECAGVDVLGENFLKTPERYVDFLWEYLNPAERLEDILAVDFPSTHDELVMVTGIEWESLCPHHMLPFWGMASVGYIPSHIADREYGHVVGISKLARLVTHFTHRFTLQEEATTRIADALTDHLKVAGCMVVLKAEHSCMSRRGVHQTHARTVTSAARGCFRDNKDGCKDEFLTLSTR